MTIGQRIKAMREQKELSQSALGSLLNKSQGTIAKYEKDLAEMDYSTLMKFCDYFNCSIDYLLGRVDEPNIEIKKVPSEDGTTELDIGVSKGTDLTQDEITALRELLKKNKQGQ